jgi:predicted RNA-binding protein YlxR (DUF448 family)
VRAPDGGVGFDVRARMDGRGAWTCARAECVEQAAGRGGFARAFSAPVLTDGDVVATVREVLEAEALRGLSLLRRQQRLWTGRTEALRAVGSGEATRLVAAWDLSPRSVREVEDIEAELLRGPPKLAIGAALGRGPTGVVALAAGPLADRVAGDLKRLAALNTDRQVAVDANGPSLRSHVTGV